MEEAGDAHILVVPRGLETSSSVLPTAEVSVALRRVVRSPLLVALVCALHMEAANAARYRDARNHLNRTLCFAYAMEAAGNVWRMAAQKLREGGRISAPRTSGWA